MNVAEMLDLTPPKDATHFVLDDDGFSAAWYKYEGATLYGQPMATVGPDQFWTEIKGGVRAVRSIKNDAEAIFERSKKAL